MDDRRKKLDLQHAGRAPDEQSPPPTAPRFTGLGIVETRARYAFPRHQHETYEVILVDRGTYRCTVNGVPLTLRQDKGVVIKPGDRHEDFCEKPLKYFGLHFQFQSVGKEPGAFRLFSDHVTPRQQCFLADRRTFGPIISEIQREARKPDAVSPHVQDALLLEFFWRLVRTLPRDGISDRFLDLSLDRVFPAQLERLFRTYQASNLCVADMAAQLGMSESSLAHTCKKLLGVPPARAFVEYKMKRAAHLLRNTAMSVKEIGVRLGFADPYHFSRSFKRITGRAPSDGRA